ncbi:hypothetical protein [Virgibacillus oceani]|uniref:Uncharacterized protein n=1 Tax=Virgibacillus oceani TaxID=1479511 RepID=A0A917GYN0_9BACI|nr:hypothetical protein [Virgibacillus oceani]GGG61455.1 hypothetical protein GCM10011398_00950 [Virgibacillus oceani]
MKVKNVTAGCQVEVSLIKGNSPWENSKVKIYDSKTSRFIHEASVEGQVLSISRADKPVTEKELMFAVTKLMNLEFEDVVIYTSPNGVLYIKQINNSQQRTAECYH